ncbi:MAG: hypothetical protein K2G47_04760 [Muribaculum sp.]|nr:hypothetical protein [Muribaculum sp.]
MRKILIYITASILACCLACSRDKAAIARLDSADSLMESQPDSALCILKSINRDIITGNETKARYALLMSQALDKNYIDVTSDSLIATATRFYADRPDSPELMKSLFYQATTYYNDGRFDRAAADATHAYEIALKLDDPFWTGKTAEIIADIFNCTYNYDECLNYRNIAVASYAKTGKQNFHQWALLELATGYSNIEKYDSSYTIIKRLVYQPNFLKEDSALVYHCLYMVFNYFFETEKFDSAKIHFNKFREYNYRPLNTANYGEIGITEVFLGNLDQAKIYIDSAYSLCSDNIHDILSADMASLEYARITKNHVKYAELTRKILHLQNDIVKETTRQSAMGAQRDFYNHQSELAAEKESKMRGYVTIGIIIAVVIIAVIITFFKTRMTLKNNAIELKINEVALLSAEIDKRENECRMLKSQLIDIVEKADTQLEVSQQEAKLRQLVNRLLAGHFNSINKILDEYYESTDTPTAKAAIYNRVEKELKNLSSSKSMGEIENLVNDALDGIMTRFRNEFPDATKEDITIFLLNAAGLSQKAISLLTGIKLKSLYTKRARLKERILKSGVSGCNEYLARLS